MNKIDVAVIIGSDSDLEIIKETKSILDRFGVRSEIRVISAHRSPNKLRNYIKKSIRKGVKIFIAAAGGAAHLPGVIASYTSCPVIGIPIPSKISRSLDSILSILQMPKGVPVATVAAGKAGAINAAILASQILAINDPDLRKKLTSYKKELELDVKRCNKKVAKLLSRGQQ